MPSRRAVLGAAAMLPLLSLPRGALAQASEEGALAAIRELYERTLKGEGPDWIGATDRTRELSVSLARLWAQADARPPPDGEVGPVDFDLIASTNGLALKSYEAKLETRARTRASVAVALTYEEETPAPGAVIVRYDMVREGNAWKIDNIRGEDWALRDLLTNWLKQQ